VPNSAARTRLVIVSCRAALAGGPIAEPVRVDHVGLVAPDVIGITLSARRVEYGRQIPYVKQEGDVVADLDIHRDQGRLPTRARWW
jgi:hypothetical protein